MDIFYLILFGAIGGIIGGMGMGGGTLLIPLLTIFLGFNQQVAQGINLLAFLPMASVALAIHFKKKMVETKGLLYIIIPGVISCIGGAYLASLLSSDILRIIFGSFLILLSVWEFVKFFKVK